MINTFKENDNKSSIDNLLQNKDDYKLLAKTAYKKHQNNIERAIEHTNYKYDPDLSTQLQKVFHHPNTKETVISHSGTNFRDKNIFNDLKADTAIFFGMEKQNKRFKQSQEHLNKVKSKYVNEKTKANPVNIPIKIIIGINQFFQYLSISLIDKYNIAPTIKVGIGP